jgi:opacity protein-like surface antigen
MKKVLILLMIAALLLPTAAFAKAAVPVTFDDPVLEAEIRAITGIPEGARLTAAVAISYPDWSFPANKLDSTREPVEAVTTWHGFE